MKILVACEFSGIVREAFKAKGHDAWSCDLLPTEIPGQHIQGDVLEILNDGWDLMIAHPPCTHLACSGAAWFKNKRRQQDEAVRFFAMIMFSLIDKICIENPVGVISTRIRKPDQIIQPYDFGDPFQKTTCLWLKNLPFLNATTVEDPLFGEHIDKGEFIRYASGNVMPKWYAESWGDGHARSKTFQGIANAMAEQWG
jgi:site-specific DNA-cytosine methylase